MIYGPVRGDERILGCLSTPLGYYRVFENETGELLGISEDITNSDILRENDIPHDRPKIKGMRYVVVKLDDISEFTEFGEIVDCEDFEEEGMDKFFDLAELAQCCISERKRVKKLRNYSRSSAKRRDLGKGTRLPKQFRETLPPKFLKLAWSHKV